MKRKLPCTTDNINSNYERIYSNMIGHVVLMLYTYTTIMIIAIETFFYRLNESIFIDANSYIWSKSFITGKHGSQVTTTNDILVIFFFLFWIEDKIIIVLRRKRKKEKFYHFSLLPLISIFFSLFSLFSAFTISVLALHLILNTSRFIHWNQMQVNCYVLFLKLCNVKCHILPLYLDSVHSTESFQ